MCQRFNTFGAERMINGTKISFLSLCPFLDLKALKLRAAQFVRRLDGNVTRCESDERGIWPDRG